MPGASVFGFGESDSEDELPAGWEERTTLDGRVYYANHSERATQWNHPRTGKRKKLVGDLPDGWERRMLADGKVIFENQREGKTTFTDPRLAFAIEETDTGKGSSLTSGGGPRQKFDASSTGLQILHGIDLSNKTFAITGGTAGIGFETVRSLAMHNAHVVIFCRNLQKGKIIKAKIEEIRPHAKIDFIECDLTSLKSVDYAAKEFLTKQWPLHCLILNAAVFGLPFTQTDDNYETTFQVNHLSQWWLATRLRQKLVESAPSRIVFVSSESHRYVNQYSLTPLKSENLDELFFSPKNPSAYWWMQAYNLSKLCNVFTAFAMDRKLRSRKVRVFALHPGNMVPTELTRNSCLMKVLFALVRPFTKSMQQACATTIFCAVAPEIEAYGGYYFNNCWFSDADPVTKVTRMQDRLMELSSEMVKRVLNQSENENEGYEENEKNQENEGVNDDE